MKLLLALLVLLAACGKRVKHDDVPPEDELWIGREAFERGSRVAEAGVRELPQSISTGGRIAFDDLLVSHVFSPVTGRVTRVLAQLGAKVAKGTALAAIVSPDVGTANSDLVKARADLAATERDFHRQEKLRDAGRAAISRPPRTPIARRGRKRRARCSACARCAREGSTRSRRNTRCPARSRAASSRAW